MRIFVLKFKTPHASETETNQCILVLTVPFVYFFYKFTFLDTKVTNEYHGLEKEEVNIIAGALELRRKTVGDIMTRLEDVFMLSYESVLDFETVAEIMKQGVAAQ